MFRKTGQNENPWKPTPEIVERGPFTITRNPMYLQMIVVCIGVAVTLMNVWILLLTPIGAWVLQRLAIIPEEAYLEKKFGDTHRAYKRRVRRWLVVSMLLAPGCKAPAPAERQTTADPPPATAGYVAAGRGVRLFYRAVGAGRDTIVVLHGGPGFNMEYFIADLEPLARGHTLLFYDQRGSGRSSLVSDSAGLDGERFADDLEAVRGYFKLERLTLLGHSWGAGVAALYAAKHPDRLARLMIVGTIPLQRAMLVQAFEALAAGRDSSTRRQMEYWREARHTNPGDAKACREYYVLWFRPFYGDTAAAGRSKGDFCAGTPDALRNKITSVDRFTAASLGDWDWRPALRAVAAPTLVIHGTADVLPVEGARDWIRTLPNSRLLLLQGVGHFPYLEAPARFFPAVEEFLEGRWPEGATPDRFDAT